MTPNLARLIALARAAPPMTAAEWEAQRIGLAWGNVAFENPAITREMVEAAAARMRAAQGGANR